MNKVLVIDDDKELCALIKRSVLTENIEADCCNSGKEGLEKLREKVIQMVKHVLMIKLKDNAQAECEKLRDLFLTMKGRVPQVIDVEAGADFLHSDRSFDVCLYVTLESPEALEAYQQDPYHCEVVKTYVASVREKAVAVDYIV